MKVALLGAGRIGVMHARLLASLPGVELLVADVDASRAAQVAAEVGGTASPTVEAAIAAADALAIASSTDTHADLVRAGVARGIPMFCEKPLAKDLAGSIALAAEVEAAGAVLQLGFQRRFDAGYVEARRMVQSGELGIVYLARLAGHDPAPPAEAYIPVSGGLFRDFSVHDFDIIRWLLDAEVEEVYADGGVRGFPMFATYGDVDSAVATLRMSNGVLVAMTASRHDPRGLRRACGAVRVQGLDLRGLRREDAAAVRGARRAGARGGRLERLHRALHPGVHRGAHRVRGRRGRQGPLPLHRTRWRRGAAHRGGRHALPGGAPARAPGRDPLLSDPRGGRPPAPAAPAGSAGSAAPAGPGVPRHATIAEVAARAGVSTATVSRVLSGVSAGRPRTRERILAAAAALDYRPSGVARSLKLRTTQTLGLVITDIQNPFYPELVRAVEDRARELGYALLLGNSVADPDRELAYLELLAARRIDGLIIAAADIPERHAAWLARTPLPVVLINGETTDGSRPAAISDNAGGGRAAAEHLLALGHRRLGLVTVARPDRASRERVEGIRQAVRDAGLDPGTLAIAEGVRDAAGGEAAMTELLARAPQITGVLCHNDLMAIGALRAARAAGTRRPGHDEHRGLRRHRPGGVRRAGADDRGPGDRRPRAGGAWTGSSSILRGVDGRRDARPGRCAARSRPAWWCAGPSGPAPRHGGLRIGTPPPREGAAASAAAAEADRLTAPV